MLSVTPLNVQVSHSTAECSLSAAKVIHLCKVTWGDMWAFVVPLKSCSYFMPDKSSECASIRVCMGVSEWGWGKEIMRGKNYALQHNYTDLHSCQMWCLDKSISSPRWSCSLKRECCQKQWVGTYPFDNICITRVTSRQTRYALHPIWLIACSSRVWWLGRYALLSAEVNWNSIGGAETAVAYWPSQE